MNDKSPSRHFLDNAEVAECCVNAFMQSVFLGLLGWLCLRFFSTKKLGLQNFLGVLFLLGLTAVPLTAWALRYSPFSWAEWELSHLITEQELPVSESSQEEVNNTVSNATVAAADGVSEGTGKRVIVKKRWMLSPLRMINVFAWIWIVGAVLAFVSKIGVYLLLLRKLVAYSTRQTIPMVRDILSRLGLSKHPVYYTDWGSTPFVFGLFKPSIVIPREVVNHLSEDELARILHHEKGHLENRDLWWGLLQVLAMSVQWWNPFASWISQRFSAIRECICDEKALGEGSDVRKYAECLLGLSQSMPVAARGTLGFTNGFHQLEWRLRVLYEYESAQLVSWRSFAGSAVLFLFALGLALLGGIRADFGLVSEEEKKQLMYKVADWAKVDEIREMLTADREDQELVAAIPDLETLEELQQELEEVSLVDIDGAEDLEGEKDEFLETDSEGLVAEAAGSQDLDSASVSDDSEVAGLLGESPRLLDSDSAVASAATTGNAGSGNELIEEAQLDALPFDQSFASGLIAEQSNQTDSSENAASQGQSDAELEMLAALNSREQKLQEEASPNRAALLAMSSALDSGLAAMDALIQVLPGHGVAAGLPSTFSGGVIEGSGSSGVGSGGGSGGGSAGGIGDFADDPQFSPPVSSDLINDPAYANGLTPQGGQGTLSPYTDAEFSGQFVPEPSTAMLLYLLAGSFFFSRRRNHNK